MNSFIGITDYNWKNRLVTLLIWLLKPRSETSQQKKRILVVTTTALGDTLWATPSISNLRNSFPHAHIAVLTSPIGKQALLHDPRIDALYLLDNPLFPRFFSLWRLLKKQQYDTALLLHSSQRLILPLLTLSGIPQIIGTAEKNKGFDHLLTTTLPRQYEHEIERRARIVQELGASITSDTLSYFLLPREREKAQQLLGPKKAPRIALHLGAKEKFRRLPQKSFIALGKMLDDCELFLTGTKEEEEILQEVQHQLPNARVILEPFRTFAAILEQMDLIVTTDTGPLHLACALNKPLICLFVSSDPLLFGPHKAPHAQVLQHKISCNPCLKRNCHEPFCFLQFSVQEIANACREKLCLSPLKNKKHPLSSF